MRGKGLIKGVMA